MSSKQSSVKSLPFLSIPTRPVPSPSASPVVPHTPIYTDSPSLVHPHNPIILRPETPRRLLIPHFDKPLVRPAVSHVGGRPKHHKLARHHKSHPHELLSAIRPSPEPHHPLLFDKFHVFEDNKRLAGFQCYAVEKWLVERDPHNYPLTTITTLTNDNNDVINAVVLAPSSAQSPAAAEEELQEVIYQLKRNGARPHETVDGIIMLTSLNSFRGDLNLIHIPDGDCNAHRCQLFTNINLARMGCAGRSAPSLEVAPASTQNKFLVQYAIPASVPALVGFNNRDGLLCDLTVKGMQQWVTEIGEPYFRLEPMAGVLEPSAVAAMLSLVATFRWRLYALGASAIPKDPFYDPEAALAALVAFQSAQEPVPYLSLSLLKEVTAAHKAIKSEPYKVHKAIMHRPEEFEVETMEIDKFVRGIVGAGKDGIDSLRFVWAGKARKERKKERDEDKDTAGETDEVSEHIGRMLRKGAGGVHALASGVVDGVKDGVKELGGLARSRKGTDALPIIKFTQSDPEPEADAMSAPRSTKSSFLGLPSASSSMSELSRTNKRLSFPSAKSGSLKSFQAAMAAQAMGHIEMRPRLRRTRTDARDVFMERDEDEMSPVSGPKSPHNWFESAAACRNARRSYSLSDIHALDEPSCLCVERMRTDVDLCGQYLELRDKEVKMRHAITIAQITLAAVQRTNTHLERELTAHKQALETLTPRAYELHNIARTYQGEADDLSKNSEMLEYQLDRLEEGVKEMTRAVAGGRNRVRALRGEARRIGGVHGLEDDSDSDEENEPGANAKHGIILGMQSVAGMKSQLGAWLGVSRVRAERSRE
ncbi:reovirus sigma C capsid domain protein [Ceratobasidium sp. AG-Ba]|nr:reovirus sigma C capsid domain protein [Ceratobasidium sp. AG-Ba]